MHRKKGESNFSIVNSAVDRLVFSHVDGNNLKFLNPNYLAHPKEIYLSSVNIMPVGWELLFNETENKPELPPGVRRIDLDEDEPDITPKTTKLSLLDYYQSIKMACIQIDDRQSGQRLLWSNLLLFMPNRGAAIQLDPAKSLHDQILLINISNGWSIDTNSAKFKTLDEIYISIDNAALPELGLDLLVVLNFEVEPFDQQMYGTWTPVNPNPPVLPWLTTAPNTETVYTVPPGREMRIDGVTISALNGTNRVYINGVEVPPSGSTPS